MYIYKDEKLGFIELFNEKNGTLLRSDVNGINPYMRSFPELIDVGVMGHCTSSTYCRNAGIDCYQQGNCVSNPHMSVKNFEMIARQASGKTFQFALGGAGDPNKHPYFEELLRICRYYRIVPNLTTSGFCLADKEIDCIKKYCGAVAVSWYTRLKDGTESNPATLKAIERLYVAGCTINAHFIVSCETIDEAIERLSGNGFPKSLNAVIFILYKPVGFGKKYKLLDVKDSRVARFIKLALKKHNFQVGFDTCFTPALLRYANNISVSSIDACEAATFSMYIDSRLNCYPCSFGIWGNIKPDNLHVKTIRQVWEGKQFTEFREHRKEKCCNCSQKMTCRYGCRLGLEIDLC